VRQGKESGCQTDCSDDKGAAFKPEVMTEKLNKSVMAQYAAHEIERKSNRGAEVVRAVPCHDHKIAQ
jgi:hypothetical protein